tara:strand:+ start:1717 stop:2775 length:1059 start_codon:yes stop_codon:yes gene_type:complete
MKKKILILGAGLSGIYLGHKLKKAGFSIKILEASNSIGGRIYTKKSLHTKVELGATWLWKYNEALLKLCKELHISLFEQNMTGEALFQATRDNLPQRFQISQNQEISYRIVGGTATILEKLCEGFSADELVLNQKVTGISEDEPSIKVLTEKDAFVTDLIISTIPPQLLMHSVNFPSELDANLVQIAKHTHTWMKDSIKFAITYTTPFWQEKGLSGAGFSNVGPFTEIYDHSDYENNHFALMGFLNGALADRTSTYREAKIKEQLFQFFGKKGKNYLSYEEKVWPNDELVSFKNDQFLRPHANNGHQIYQQEFLNGKFIVAGSETSTSYGGYMEGAIYRGNEITRHLENKFK